MDAPQFQVDVEEHQAVLSGQPGSLAVAVGGTQQVEIAVQGLALPEVGFGSAGPVCFLSAGCGEKHEEQTKKLFDSADHRS